MQGSKNKKAMELFWTEQFIRPEERKIERSGLYIYYQKLTNKWHQILPLSIYSSVNSFKTPKALEYIFL